MLVVEDEFLIADHIAYTLECAGHVIVGTAASADEALQALSDADADLAVLDIKLKGDMDGVELAHLLRDRGVPHIFISGSGDPGTRARADQTGALAFLQKPFSESELIAVVESLSREA